MCGGWLPWVLEHVRLALIAGTGEDSVFGFGFFPGILALVIWSIATSLARYRAVASAAREPLARETDG